MLLLHHAGDDRNMARLIKDWLSPSLPLHGFTRRILQAALDDLEARATLHIPALANDPDPLFKSFHTMLARADSRINISEELKPLDEARELVSKIWFEEILKSRRESLAPGDPRRPRLTRAIKLLQHASWEVRQQILRPLLSGEEPPPAENPPPPPSAPPIETPPEPPPPPAEEPPETVTGLTHADEPRDLF